MEISPKIDKGKMKNQLSERVRQFACGISEYTSSTYNETEVRIDFVNPFFKALGWDVDNEAGLMQHLREVTHEATVLVEENGQQRSKKPDYSFRVGTETFFYLETKKPSVDITKDSAPAFQLRRYGWSGNLKISVLTNFTDLYIYDCSVRPTESDDIGVALIAHYCYTEYEDKFDEIYGLLSKEAIISGAFTSKFENVAGAFRREPFDSYFLNQIKHWRTMLGTDIYHNVTSIDEETLNIAVQRILNRIIFLRICEDRNLEQYETLKQIHTYKELKSLFNAADKKYDSGLFTMLEEDNVAVSDDVLLEIFCDLYYPNSSYEFSVVDPFIIGQIYELFLDEKLVIDGDGSISTEKKPEAIDAQGAVNTPKSLTDIIVEQTLSVVCKGKTSESLRNVRIADICCGAGNFLLSAYEFIINFHTEWLLSNEKDNAIQDGRLIIIPGSNTCRLSFSLRRDILVRNIWGVDIDPLAVEVAKFSLCLKLLENTTVEELNVFTHETSNRILPQLDDNIKNGNSLVDTTYVKYSPNVYDDISELGTVRMLDWEDEFDNEKFDAIIGNPPYIRVQNMVRYSPREYGFYRSKFSGYETAKSDLLDKYHLFIERAWSLVKENGIIGYIVPHKFMTIMSGEHLRKFLASKEAVWKIIHLGTHQAFKGRSTYTCILLLNKSFKTDYSIAFVNDLNHFLYNHEVSFDTYPIGTLSSSPWTFIPHQINEVLSDIREGCSPLENIARIFVGVQTSNDKIYIITPDHEDDTYVYFYDKNGENRKIERGILRKSIYDAQMQKYHPIIPNSYIIFPYQNDSGKPELIDIRTMRSTYPFAFAYLSKFKEELDKRHLTVKRTDSNWYAYGRSQSLSRFLNGEHLIWPVLSLDSNYVYDNNLVIFTGGGNGPFYGIEIDDKTDESIFYIQAILNHWLMELLVRKSASTFRGGYYSHGKQFIAKLPIRRINFTDEAQKSLHDDIVDKVHRIENLIKQMTLSGNSSKKKTLERAVNSTQKELSALIDKLYNVEGLQVIFKNESD